MHLLQSSVKIAHFTKTVFIFCVFGTTFTIKLCHNISICFTTCVFTLFVGVSLLCHILPAKFLFVGLNKFDVVLCRNMNAFIWISFWCLMGFCIVMFQTERLIWVFYLALYCFLCCILLFLSVTDLVFSARIKYFYFCKSGAKILRM